MPTVRKKGIIMSNQHVQSYPQGFAQAQARLGTLRAVLSQRLARVGQALWKALEAGGRSRANREMLILAEQYRHTNPKLARELHSYVRGGSTY
jgi:hypothetical protein